MDLNGIELDNVGVLNIASNSCNLRPLRGGLELSKGPAVRSSSTCQRKELTLADKVEFIKFYETAGLSIRAAALKFNIGKTAGFGILKRKDEYLKHYALNADSSRRRMRRSSKFHEVNLCTWKWFSSAHNKNFNISGPKLQEKALKFANKLGIENFKASNGWLESFKKCYNVQQQQMHKNSSKEMDFMTKLDWKSKLSNLIADRTSENIFCCKITPLLFRASPHKGLPEIMESGSSASSLIVERLNLIFCFSVHGEKLTPWVFGSCEHSAAASLANSNNIVWRMSEDGEISRDIFLNYLEHLNSLLQQKARKILLFLDSSFSNDLSSLELSQITLYYFPTTVNTLEKYNPIDSGVLQFVKAHYRKQLLCAVLPYLDALTNCGEVVEYYKCISINEALPWIAQAWDAVSHNLIMKSCGEAGFIMTQYGTTSGSAELLYCELSGLLNLLAKSVTADVVAVNDYIELDNNNNVSNSENGGGENPSEDDLEDQIAMEVVAERNGTAPEELLSLNLETDEEELLHLYPPEEDKNLTMNGGEAMSYKEAFESICKLRNFAKAKEICLLPMLNELKSVMETLLAEKSKEIK